MAEVRPGNRSVAHHASVIIRPPGSQWMKDAKVGAYTTCPAHRPISRWNGLWVVAKEPLRKQLVNLMRIDSNSRFRQGFRITLDTFGRR